MLDHVLRVRRREASVCPEEVVQGGVDADTVSLDLDSEWDGMPTSVVFLRYGRDAVEVPYADRPVRVPWELLGEPGPLYVSCVGTRLEGGSVARRLVSKRLACPMRVVPGGPVSGTGPSEGPDDPSGPARVPVPRVSEDGTLGWEWGEAGDALPDPVDVRGSQWITGEGGPAVGGRPGDLYLDVATGEIYRYGEVE